MTTVTTRFKLFEEKKHSVRYNAEPTNDADPCTVSIYVNKAILTRPYPKFINVTVSEGEGV